MEEQEKIKKALMKKALGYNANEVIVEYTIDATGKKQLSKKKVTKKHYSPDISAVKVLLERYYKTYEEDVHSMSDQVLFEEKERLISEIKEESDGD